MFFRENPNSPLNNALKFLGISQKEFEHIPTKLMKREFLDCALARFEFETIRKNPHDKEALSQADAVYTEILKSSYFKKETYSSNSMGLQRLMMKTSPDERRFTKVAEKLSGVEPGFIGELDEDIYRSMLKLFPDAEIRRDTIRHLNGDIAAFRHIVGKVLPRYMFKLAYREISADGKVTPDLADLARSNTMQKFRDSLPSPIYAIDANLYKMQKTRDWVALNCEAVAEVVANDLARVYGMTVQEQMLFPSQYTNGYMQLLLAGKWVEGARELGDNGACLAGESCHQYLVKPLMQASGDLRFRTDNNVKLASLLCMMIVLGDRDGIGKKAQNKLVVNNELVGIDFGKAFQSTELIDNIGCDFRVPDKLLDNFPNYSIFHDAPRSEFVKGLLMLAGISCEYRARPTKQTLLSYGGEKFRQQYENMPIEGDSVICEDYANIFAALREEYILGNNEIAAANAVCCTKIIESVAALGKSAEVARNKLLSKFSVYFIVEKETADMFENIERVIAGKKDTTMRSHDGSVLLQHVRVMRNTVKEWRYLYFEGNSMHFGAVFENNKQAELARLAILAWTELVVKQDLIAKNNGTYALIKKINKKIKVHNSTLVMIVNKDKLRFFYDLFSEDKIKKAFHPAEQALEWQIHYEDQISALLKSMSVYGVNAALICNKKQYYIYVWDTNNITAAFKEQVEAAGVYQSMFKGGLSKPFNSTYLRNLLNMLDKIMAQLEHEASKISHLVTAQVECKKYVNSWQLPSGFNIQLTYQPGNYGMSGHYKIHTESTNEILQELLTHNPYLNEQHTKINFSELNLVMLKLCSLFHRLTIIKTLENKIETQLSDLDSSINRIKACLYEQMDKYQKANQWGHREYTLLNRFIEKFNTLTPNRLKEITTDLTELQAVAFERYIYITLSKELKDKPECIIIAQRLKGMVNLLQLIITDKDQINRVKEDVELEGGFKPKNP